MSDITIWQFKRPRQSTLSSEYTCCDARCNSRKQGNNMHHGTYSLYDGVLQIQGRLTSHQYVDVRTKTSEQHTLQQISKRGNPVHSPDWSDPVLKLQGSAVIVGLVMLYFFGLDWASMKSHPPPRNAWFGVPIVISPCSMCDSPYRFAQSRVQVLFPPQGRVSGPVCMHVCIPISPQTSPDLVGCECRKCRDA